MQEEDMVKVCRFSACSAVAHYSSRLRILFVRVG